MYRWPIILLCIGSSIGYDISTLYKWTCMDVSCGGDSECQKAMDNGEHDPTKIVPFDFAVDKGGRHFLTTPKLYYSNLASLWTISDEMGDGGPLLKIFGNYSSHSNSDCSKIISVLRIAMDDCNRMWVVDNGVVAGEQKCPPKLLGFDLETDECVANIPMSDDLPTGNPTSLITAQFVETSDNCQKIAVYMTDMGNGAILVYQGSTTGGDIQRYDHPAFKPTSTELTVDNNTIYMNKNIGPSSMEIISRSGNDAIIIVMTLGSRKPLFMTLKDLNSMENCPLPLYENDFENKHSIMDVAWTGSVGFAVYSEEHSISCWCTENQLSHENIKIFESDPERINMATSVQVINEDLYILSIPFDLFTTGIMNSEMDNVFILRGRVATILEKTICEPSSNPPEDITPESMGLTRVPDNPPSR